MMHLVGEVKNKDAIIIDDMIDTAVKLNYYYYNFFFRGLWLMQLTS